MILFIIYSLTHNQLRSYRLNTFDDVESSEQLVYSKRIVIDKINNSRIISNKKELEDRVNNVTYKHYERFSLVKGIDGNNRMSYLYDKISNKDYIIVKSKYYEDDKLSLIHELNHLVDRHKIVDTIIKPHSVLIQLDREDYVDFFEDWYVFDKKFIVGEMAFGQEFLPDTDRISTGDLLYAFIKSQPTYYLSDSEIYARLSGMKSFMVDKGALIDINEIFDERHVLLTINSIREMSEEKIINCGSEDDDFMMSIYSSLDWIMYAPLINYDKTDELNLIL